MAETTLQAVRDLLTRGSVRRYGSEHRSQAAELRVPRGAGPFPVAVLIHGGYWRAKTSRRYMRLVAGPLVRAGWATWNVEYRRLGAGGGWPMTFEDLAAGIDALADQPEAARGLLDLEHVAAIGHSAGGQMALWSAARAKLPVGAPGSGPRVQVGAVVGMAAVCNMEHRVLVTPGQVVNELMGGTPAEVPERYEVVNPMRFVPFGVPLLLLHPPGDETVPAKRSVELAAAAREAGDEVELVMPEGEGHRTIMDPRREPLGTVLGWLGRLGWTEGGYDVASTRTGVPMRANA
jgi:acetyl esterase/lipase